MTQGELKKKVASLPDKDNDLPIMIFYQDGPSENDIYEYIIWQLEELNGIVFLELIDK